MRDITYIFRNTTARLRPYSVFEYRIVTRRKDYFDRNKYNKYKQTNFINRLKRRK